ncbi:Kinesin-like protein KIF16B [Stylophora pistillata]|uniref:Kinesin-like protein KIF16B n=1 Tax=Stylophora pistillata TaxID=50429 RepID=A0A2B4RR43_STYPI|nr:Kinesin-like protein KIF16B [Stylophora pistillata]
MESEEPFGDEIPNFDICGTVFKELCKDIDGLYARMESIGDDKTEFRTEVSYLEIYNERVGDLLRPAKGREKFNLKVREHPKEGPYVQDLTKHVVKDYEGIGNLMEEGNTNRTVASTNMNDVSSRSHAIFTILFTQAKFYTDMPSETVSKIHLVDLAGRTKDSLVSFRHVCFLSEIGFMCFYCAISPADVNYSETLSTLRYANRAKNIINKPTVNESSGLKHLFIGIQDPNVRLIRELRAEIDRLKVLLQAHGQDGVGELGAAEESQMTEKLHENEARVEELTKNWTSKWRETQKIIEDGMTYIGREDANFNPDIVLSGPGIEAEHCIMESIEGTVILHPLASLCQVNGLPVGKSQRISQGDVILLGKTNMLRFNHPQEAAKLRKKRYYESMENLADLSSEPEREPSYMFYNAGKPVKNKNPTTRKGLHSLGDHGFTDSTTKTKKGEKKEKKNKKEERNRCHVAFY